MKQCGREKWAHRVQPVDDRVREALSATDKHPPGN